MVKGNPAISILFISFKPENHDYIIQRDFKDDNMWLEWDLAVILLISEVYIKELPEIINLQINNKLHVIFDGKSLTRYVLGRKEHIRKICPVYITNVNVIDVDIPLFCE